MQFGNVMSAKWLVLLVLLGVVALFVPFIPQTQASGHFVGVQYEQTAIVSPTYYAFHCGSYVDSRVTAQLASGYAGFYQLSNGYAFTCNYNSR
jgi:hypothetical protein